MRTIESGPLMSLIGPPTVGTKYHVSWGNSHGVVGRCVEVHEATQEVTMRSPKTKIVWKKRVKWSDLRYLRYDQAVIMKNKNQ